MEGVLEAAKGESYYSLASVLLSLKGSTEFHDATNSSFTTISDRTFSFGESSIASSSKSDEGSDNSIEMPLKKMKAFRKFHSSSSDSIPTKSEVSISSSRDNRKLRGSYRCGKCGLPKIDHVCKSDDEQGVSKSIGVQADRFADRKIRAKDRVVIVRPYRSVTEVDTACTTQSEIVMCVEVTMPNTEPASI